MNVQSARHVESESEWRALSAAERSVLRAKVREFGFAALDGSLHADLLAGLCEESSMQLGASVSVEVDEPIRFRARMGTLGPTARRFLQSRATLDLLRQVFDASLVLSDDASCFTYYGSGDVLGLHLDRPVVCEVTLIVYLSAAGPSPSAPDTGLVLNIYGSDRPAGEAPRLVIPTVAGSVVVGRGGATWHERPPLRPGEQVTALTACFSLANGCATTPDC